MIEIISALFTIENQTRVQQILIDNDSFRIWEFAVAIPKRTKS